MELVPLPHQVSVGGEYVGLRLKVAPYSIEGYDGFARIDVELLTLHGHFRVRSEGYSPSEELYAFANDSTRTSLEFQGFGPVKLRLSRIEPGNVRVELEFDSSEETISVEVDIFDRWEFEEWHGS